MVNSGFGESAAVETTQSINQPSTAEQSPASKKATRRASKATAPTKQEAAEILSSALELCRQAGYEVHAGKVGGSPVLAGITLYPMVVTVVDGVTHFSEAQP